MSALPAVPAPRARGTAPAALAGPGLAAKVAALARLMFGATLFLIPFRLRLTLLARPFIPVYSDYTDLLLFASDACLLATLAFWALHLRLAPRRLRTGPRFIWLPLAGLTLLALVSTLASVDPVLSLYHAVRLLLLAALYLYVVTERLSHRQLAAPLAVQMVVQALIGVAQVVQQHSLGLAALQELELDPAWSGVSIVFAGGVRSLRAYGLADHPNILGGCLAFGLLLLGAWAAESETKRRAWVYPVFALGTLALLLTFSRAAWLAFGAGCVCLALAAWRAGRHAELRRGCGLALAAAVLVLPFAWRDAAYLGARLDQGGAFTQAPIEARSLSERDRLNEAVARIVREHPLLGAGIGALPRAEQLRYPDFAAFNANYQPAHVVLLDVAAEIGIPGALLYALLLAAPWAALWLRRGRLGWSPALAGASALLLALTLVGLFDYYPWLLAPGRLWQWLAWGLWAAAWETARGGAARA